MYEQAVAIAGSTRGYAGPTDAPRAVGHISEQAEESQRLAETLAQEVASLEQRVSMVLRPTGPQASNGTAKEGRPSMSAYAEGLTSLNARLHGIISHVRDIAARADL